MDLFPNANVRFILDILLISAFNSCKISDAQCVSLPDDKNEGLKILRADEASVLVPFRENVTLLCGNTGRKLRNTATSGFRQCVYDPKPVSSVIV